jgi:predicted DCC family thiol-disulfide oxidoreductase YuxK
MRADLGTVDFSWMAWTPWIAALACWVTVVVEIGYAIFIWPRRTRKWCALAIIVMHVGIALTLGLAAFSAIMILLTFCAWLVPCEPPSARAARQTGFVVAYDGSCSICRQVVGLALGVSRRAFVPVGRNHGRRVPALGNCDGLEQMMAVTRDGRIRAGADAFFVMWAHALGWPRVQILARLAPVRAGYFLFASHRHRLGCHGRCSVSARVTRAA